MTQFGPQIVGSIVAGASGDHHGGAQKTAVQARVRGPERSKSVGSVGRFCTKISTTKRSTRHKKGLIRKDPRAAKPRR